MKHKISLKIIFLFLIGIYVISSCATSDAFITDDEEQVGNDNEEEENEGNNNQNETTNCEEAYNYELPEPNEEVNLSNWTLEWEDNFDYENDKLEDNWASQNGPSGHILCSRWRENSVVADSVLELKAKKESRGGQDWTCGNLWTKETFGYGYYECKYKYAGASGTNNSFWLFPRDKGVGGSELICELDINEGHFPNEVNTNRHHWQNGSSENNQLAYSKGLSPAYAHSFNSAIKTKRIRFSSNNANHFHIREFRIFEPNADCYPTDILSATADTDVKGLVNLARKDDVVINASGILNDNFMASSVANGNPNVSWVSQKKGEKWLEFTWPTENNIGHIQFINGWQNGANWNALISDYKIEALVNGEWTEIASYDVKDSHNFAEQYHIYGMEWSADNLKFYFDNKLIRTIPNTLCDKELNIFLSLAILEHAGEVTDAINGTSMKIDYVKYYKPKN